MTNKIDLTPPILNLSLYAGDGEDFQIKFVDENATPIDVSALTFNAQIRKTRNSDVSFELTVNMTDSVTGIITIHVSEETTRSLTSNSQWDLQTTSSARPEPLTILQGSVLCTQDVTREA